VSSDSFSSGTWGATASNSSFGGLSIEEARAKISQLGYLDTEILEQKGINADIEEVFDNFDKGKISSTVAKNRLKSLMEDVIKTMPI